MTHPALKRSTCIHHGRATTVVPLHLADVLRVEGMAVGEGYTARGSAREGMGWLGGRRGFWPLVSRAHSTARLKLEPMPPAVHPQFHDAGLLASDCQKEWMLTQPSRLQRFLNDRQTVVKCSYAQTYGFEQTLGRTSMS